MNLFSNRTGNKASLASQTQPTPVRIAFSIMHGVYKHDIESDPCWGWLGLACETRVMALLDFLVISNINI